MELEAWLQTQIQSMEEQNLFRTLLARSEMPPLHFSSNDYLGLSEDSILKQKAMEALKELSLGSGSSRLVSGTFKVHCDLENTLASWYGKEGALTFSSGYQASVAVIPAISGNGVIFSDELNHASLIDGCRLSRAEVAVYRHGDLSHLEELLSRYASRFPRWILAESLFSMEGEKAPLQGLMALKKKHRAFLYLDEAHAIGVYGEKGRGLAEELECLPEVDLLLGTFSKAFGSMGGFVAGTKRMITYLLNSARGFIFSTAFSPLLAAVNREAVKRVEQMKSQRVFLRQKAREVRSFLRGKGFRIAGDEDAPIIPVIFGSPEEALRISKILLLEGIWIPAIRPPTVPPGTSRLRVSLSVRHTEKDYRKLQEGFSKAVGGVLVP